MYAPLYVSRKLLNAEEVAQHFLDQGLPSVLSPEEMHVTVLYSKQALHWEMVAADEDDFIVPPAKAGDRTVERLGPNGIMVLRLRPESVPDLCRRHEEYLSAGASSDYAAYKPHVSVSYAGQDVSLAQIKPFMGALHFGPEIRGPVKEDWKPNMAKEIARSTPFSPLPVAQKALHTACSCGCSQLESPGGTMSATANPQSAVAKATGVLAKLASLGLRTMTPAERVETLKDAAIESGAALSKATDLLKEGDDHDELLRVEDIFDGTRDDHLETTSGHGPASSAPSGKVNTGPAQDASGGGAERMEGEYSRHASQAGLVRATERLGRALSAHRSMTAKAFGGLVEFGKAMSTRMELLEGAVAAPSAAFDQAALDAAVAKAVSAALGKTIPQLVKALPAVIKAAGEDEKDDDKEDEKESGEEDEEEEGEEDEDEEAEQAESGSGTEIEITNEVEDEADAEDEAESDEDETKKAMKKSAAQQRLVAKSLVKLAKASMRKAEKAAKEEEPEEMRRHHRRAHHRMAKANIHLALAKALVGGKAGSSTKGIAKSLKALAKARKEMRAENQDHWPEGKAKAKSKGAEEKDDGVAKAIANMQAAVEKANAGYAMAIATVQDVMKVVGGQSRDPANTEPPTVPLAKGGSIESHLRLAYGEGRIGADDMDRGLNALAFMNAGSVPKATVDAAIASCSPVVQGILRPAA